MSTYIIVDASNLFYRCKHASQGDVSIKAGMALHIIFNSILKIWRKFNGTHVVVCLEGKSWRLSAFPEYKLHRRVKKELMSHKEKEEDELFFEIMQQFTEFMQKRTNCTVLQAQGLEADDLIGRWIDLHPNDSHVILSSDSDFIQLVSSNVKIFDGMTNNVITIDGVFDEKDQPLLKKRKRKLCITDVGKNYFAVEGNIDGLDKSGEFIHKKVTFKYSIDDNTFIVKKDVAEKLSVGNNIEVTQSYHVKYDPEWELFLKCMRGDSTDNIFSAYPKVRETALKNAYDDRAKGGYAWNNLMLQTWTDHTGSVHRVLDDYKRNKMLIDLRAQPDDVKATADNHILEKVQREPVNNVGVWFLKFCDENALVRLSQNPKPYADYLSATYLPRT